MIVKIEYLFILQLILVPLFATGTTFRGRRRQPNRKENAAVEDASEKPAGHDQVAMATQTESSRFGIQAPYEQPEQETENYPYELNLVRPENKYQTNPSGMSQYSFGNEDRELEDAETAEEYVAKAMHMYGTRMKDPIRINPGPLATQHVNKYDVFETPEPEPPTSAPVPVYEKDPVTRSYDVFDYSTYETVSEHQYEPKYESKYRYQPSPNAETAYTAPQRSVSPSNNDRLKASASSDIPKEEILKQIEKSVIKYMKELEAEGKIVSTTEPKTTYYKLQPVESTTRVKTTTKPKQQSNNHSYSTTNRNHFQKFTSKPAPTNNDEQYQSSTLHQELSDSLAPNVEFIYKIKARAPLQSMQTARPYQASSKAPPDSFDHSAALKNMEEFDISHVVPEERGPSNKPKLFFNSDIYQDINSLPFKPEKVAISRPQKIKEHPDYKGYALYPESKSEDDSEDSGYPIMNPYQFVFKKEPASPPLVIQSPSNWENSNNHNRPFAAPQKGQLEFDTYSPKFNNNPEGYGYQHQYAQNHKFQTRHPTKRGKRGGQQHAPHNKKGTRGGQLVKDVEANVALRPPPKV